MKKLVYFFFLISFLTQAQYSVKGTMSPANNYSWVLLYKVEGAKQLFIKNTQLKKENNKGTFEFELPADAKKGVYRVTYDLKKNGFVDVLFNKENVEFSFNPNNTEVSKQFQQSKENILYKDFMSDLSMAQYKVDSLQIEYLKGPSQINAEAYSKAVKKVESVQKDYNQKSVGMLVHDFIKATDRFNAAQVAKTSNEYLNGVISHFYDNIDFDNKVLYNSSFLIDRIADYVFYMHYIEDATEQLKLHKKAVDDSLAKISDVAFKADVLEFLISQFSIVKNTAMVDYLFTSHFDKLPKENQNAEFKTQILNSLKTAIGKKAPNFDWEESGIMKSLHSLNDGKNYLIVFYSTECSHCLREVPQVFAFLKDKKDTSVVAFAMETGDQTWNSFIKGYPGWHHILGLGKWENKTAREYQINSTPTYFVLSADKKIIATPESLSDLKKVLQQLN